MNINTMNLVVALAASFCATAATAATPEIVSVTMTQPGPDRRVFIDYTFSGADAVITLDVQTNAPGGAWSSIGGEAVCNATGEVWKKVANDGSTHHIEWRPDLSWPDHLVPDGGARAVVTAWALDNTPDYMVVDISETGGEDTQRYYPAADFVPGGVTNGHYKTSTILMRKIMAKDVTWTMGSVAETGRIAAREATHQVMLTNNYYIGVFEVTQTQWHQITGYNPSFFTDEYSMRPVENVSYTDIRQGTGAKTTVASATAGVYPNKPYDGSFLGILRDRTKLDFDLPSEAQWEFAARAGNGEGYWGDGVKIYDASGNIDSHVKLLSRYLGNPSSNTNTANTVATMSISPADGGTAIVGSYERNNWGLYDMNGNVYELCLDWFAEDIKALNGAVNTTPNTYRLARGGNWRYGAGDTRPAYRSRIIPSSRDYGFGLRVVCPVEIQ